MKIADSGELGFRASPRLRQDPPSASPTIFPKNHAVEKRRVAGQLRKRSLSGLILIQTSRTSDGQHQFAYLAAAVFAPDAPRFWAGDELADRLGVSPRTLRRDVDRLRELGYPVEARRGLDGGYQLAAGAALPPLVLDDDEAVALAIGLRAAAQGAIAGIEESSVRALAKVARIMPPHLRRRVDALRAMTNGPVAWSRGPNVDAAVLTTVAQACRDEERLRFAHTAQNTERSTRHVEPHRLVSLGQRLVLGGVRPRAQRLAQLPH